MGKQKFLLPHINTHINDNGVVPLLKSCGTPLLQKLNFSAN